MPFYNNSSQTIGTMLTTKLLEMGEDERAVLHSTGGSVMSTGCIAGIGARKDRARHLLQWIDRGVEDGPKNLHIL